MSKKLLLPNEQRRRLKLIVAYDGSGFRGWQSQRGGNTIQDLIESAFAKITHEPVRVHGASRTDAGVHALGQCAHVDVEGKNLPPEAWRNALNASLPPEIRIIRCSFVSAAFHARFRAQGKVYRYRIVAGPVLPPLEIDRAWHVAKPIAMETLRTAVGLFVGEHDFAPFAANRGQAPESTIRTIRSVRVQRKSNTILIDFDGDGFLYKMVRLMVGAAVRCAIGKEKVTNLREQLREPAVRITGPFVAPACGLTLIRIRY